MITYLKGDATYPEKQTNFGEGIIIAHICNDIGRWGSGFVLALSKRWKNPEQVYRDAKRYKLGEVLWAWPEINFIVANMISQHNVRGYASKDNLPPIRYDALRKCLYNVNDIAKRSNSEIHMPKIGAGLAGGDWNVIEGIINYTCTVPTFVYEWNK